MSIPEVTVHGVKKLGVTTELLRNSTKTDVFNITQITVYTSNGVMVRLRLFHDGGLNVVSGQEL